MKTNRFLVIVAAATLLTPVSCLLTSCSDKDERMLTIINEDGACSREMTFHPAQEHVMAPLSEVINTNGMIFRSGWERSWSVVGDSVRHACPMTQQQWDSLQSVLPHASPMSGPSSCRCSSSFLPSAVSSTDDILSDDSICVR